MAEHSVDHTQRQKMYLSGSTGKTKQETKSSQHLGWVIKINAATTTKTHLHTASNTIHTHLQWAIIQQCNFPDNAFRRGHKGFQEKVSLSNSPKPMPERHKKIFSLINFYGLQRVHADTCPMPHNRLFPSSHQCMKYQWCVCVCVRLQACMCFCVDVTWKKKCQCSKHSLFTVPEADIKRARITATICKKKNNGGSQERLVSME